MSICFTEACVGCPNWVVSLSFIGAIVVYLFVGWILYRLAKEIWENLDEFLSAMILIFWPMAIIVGMMVVIGSALSSVIYYVGWYLIRLFGLPIYAADKADLVKMERKLDRKITEGDSSIREYMDTEYVPPKSVRKAKKPTKPKKPSKKKKAKK